MSNLDGMIYWNMWYDVISSKVLSLIDKEPIKEQLLLPEITKTTQDRNWAIYCARASGKGFRYKENKMIKEWLRQ